MKILKAYTFSGEMNACLYSDNHKTLEYGVDF